MGKYGLKGTLVSALFGILFVCAGSALADTVEIAYTDAVGGSQTLVVDGNSSEADMALAATLILAGDVDIATTSEGATDLATITASISAAAAEVAGGSTANIAAAIAAIESVVPQRTGEINTDVPPAADVVVMNAVDTYSTVRKAPPTPMNAPAPPPTVPPISSPSTP